MTDLNKMIKAAKAVQKLTKKSVTIKYDGYIHTICVGYLSDKANDAAYNAANKILGEMMGWGGKVEMAADVTGHGVEVVATV